MSNVTQTITRTSASVTVSAAQNTKITNLSMPTANTEYSHALTTNLKQIIIRARGIAELKLAFTATESGTKYLTIEKRASLSLSDLDLSSTTVYLQSSVANTTAEILELY